jgi:hypothetical protein
MFILAQVARRRITRPPLVAAVEVDDLTALAVAEGVLDLTHPSVRTMSTQHPDGETPPDAPFCAICPSRGQH